ncbi:Gfo/Idh/MocA family protein [Pediococcus siamensis]|uniref:Gfo/Idh/MocA family protein n=1 Tax=Pediococcus siamensis TaxID=381829 RepID=UPI0039A0D562
MRNPIIRYGIMGAAKIVPRAVAGMRESPHSEVVAIAARSQQKAQKMADHLHIQRAYGSYEQLCQDPTVDVVYIPLWNAGHFNGARLALQHHKNVLLEKPFTLTYAQAKTLFELAKQQHCFLMEAQKAAFLPVTSAVQKQLLTNRAIGDICGVSIQESHPGIEQIPWFHDVTVGGGAFYGSASYALEYLQLVLKTSIIDVQGQISRVAQQADDQAQVNLTLANGVLANVFMTTKSTAVPSKLTFWGTTGELMVPNYWKTDTYFLTVNNKTQKVQIPQQSEFVHEFNHVSTQISAKQEASSVMSPQLTLATMKIIDQLYRNWYPQQFKNI